MRSIPRKVGFSKMSDGTYYAGEQMGQCQFCGYIGDTRESFCFGCADAQAIIANGTDMYDRTADDRKNWSYPDGDGVKLPVEDANKRLRLLIMNGWRPPREGVGDEKV